MNKELRKLGFNLGLGLNVLGLIMFYRHKEHFIWFSGIGSAVLISAILYPGILAPVKKILDRLIFTISWIISTFTLLIAFYIIFTPAGILLKILGKDLLSQKIDRNASSYWIRRKQNLFSKASYERMG